MMMDWTYAKWNSFDHAFWCNSIRSRRRRRRKAAGGIGRASVVLAASLVLWSSSWLVLERVVMTWRASTVGLREEFLDAIQIAIFLAERKMLEEECQPWVKIFWNTIIIFGGVRPLFRGATLRGQEAEPFLHYFGDTLPS